MDGYLVGRYDVSGIAFVRPPNRTTKYKRFDSLGQAQSVIRQLTLDEGRGVQPGIRLKMRRMPERSSFGQAVIASTGAGQRRSIRPGNVRP
ncbi:hypothetical protein IP86_01460 [Rhodopseudomonas sp. AAP120]|nr:hypothetical protein IP86_01460 [Rhodopseudomonas sp. AAP120]